MIAPEELQRMARDSGSVAMHSFTEVGLQQFADKVAAAEREACALVCEGMGALDALEGEEAGGAAMVRVADKQADLCAAIIRQRGAA